MYQKQIHRNLVCWLPMSPVVRTHLFCPSWLLSSLYFSFTMLSRYLCLFREIFKCVIYYCFKLIESSYIKQVGMWKLFCTLNFFNLAFRYRSLWDYNIMTYAQLAEYITLREVDIRTLRYKQKLLELLRHYSSQPF